MLAESEAALIEPLGVSDSIEDIITERLRKLIVHGGLPAGEKLVQRKLASRFKVSPTPIRVALQRLAAQHFIAFDENGHGHVIPLSREDLEELCAGRIGVEGLAARLGAISVDGEAITTMTHLLGELRESAQRQDRDHYLKLRWQFHEVCYLTADRPRLLAEVERLYWRAERYHHLLLSDQDRFAQSLHHYEELLAACHQRDGELAERAIANGVERAVRILSPALPSEKSFPEPGR